MCGLTSAHGHEERVQHEVLSQRGPGGPADNTAGVQVHHDARESLPSHVRIDVMSVTQVVMLPSLQRIGREE